MSKQQNIINLLSDGVCLIDKSARVTYNNESCIEFLKRYTTEGKLKPGVYKIVGGNMKSIVLSNKYHITIKQYKKDIKLLIVKNVENIDIQLKTIRHNISDAINAFGMIRIEGVNTRDAVNTVETELTKLTPYNLFS